MQQSLQAVKAWGPRIGLPKPGRSVSDGGGLHAIGAVNGIDLGDSMADDPKSEKGNGDASKRVAFDYIKSQQFRTIRADGAIGGITPSGMIHFALYSERHPIPRRLVHEVGADGELGPLIDSETIARDAIVREMEVDIFLTPPVAKSLYKWLGEKISDLERTIGKIKEDE